MYPATKNGFSLLKKVLLAGINALLLAQAGFAKPTQIPLILSYTVAPDVMLHIEDSPISGLQNPNAKAAGAAQTSVSFKEDNTSSLFVTQYDTTEWSGDIVKVVLTQNPSTHTLSSAASWSAADKLNARTSNRNIFTNDGPVAGSPKAINFLYNELSATQKASLSGGSVRNKQRIVAFIRGDGAQSIDTLAPSGDIPIRTRSSKLGDLIHSKPTYVKDNSYGYIDDTSTPYANSYEKYVADQKTREGVVYVGGNDGMLHAFSDDTTLGLTHRGGEELFAYIPSSIIANLSTLALTDYADLHQYYVDGKMSIIDAKLSNKWRTVLASPLGAGAKGLFALDVSNPTATHPADFFMWEINEKSSGYSKMGYMITSPKIGRLRTAGGEKWVLFMGNGVHSEDAKDNNKIGKAVVYVIDIESGALVDEIVLDDGVSNPNISDGPPYTNFQSANGITSVAAVDVGSDTYIDRLYAADLKGNIWRINYNMASEAFEEILDTNGRAKPIFTATGPTRVNRADSSGLGPIAVQPITAELTVTGSPNASGVATGEMIFFGTGQYFDFGHTLEKSNLKVQSMYAVWDKGDATNTSIPLTRANLEQQTLRSETATKREFNSGLVIDYTAQLGWYLDLPNYGERIVRKAVSLFEYMGFFSQLPSSDDPRTAGTEAWTMIANKDTAQSLGDSGNGSGNGNGNTSIPGGIKQAQGFIQEPIFVELKNGQLMLLSIDASDLNSASVATVFPPIDKIYSRSAWRKIR